MQTWASSVCKCCLDDKRQATGEVYFSRSVGVQLSISGSNKILGWWCVEGTWNWRFFPWPHWIEEEKMVHWFEMKESCQLLEWKDWDLCYTILLLTCKIQRNVRKNETQYSSVAKSKRRLVGQNMGYCLNSSTLQYGVQWQAVEYLEYQEVIDRVPEQIKLFLMFHTSTSPSEGFSLRWVEFRVNWLFHDLTFSQVNNKE